MLHLCRDESFVTGFSAQCGSRVELQLHGQPSSDLEPSLLLRKLRIPGGLFQLHSSTIAARASCAIRHRFETRTQTL